MRMRTTRSSRADLALSDELLEAGEGDGGGGFAADALGADLGLGEGDLLLGDLLAPAAGGAESSEGLAPGGGVADTDGGGAGVGLDGDEFPAVVVHDGAVERVGSLGLDDADLGDARDEAEVVHLGEALAERGAVGEVAAGDDDVLGDLPLELLEEFEGGGLLAFEAVGVDGVEQVDGEAVDEVGEDADAAVEVGLELDGERTVVHGLGELAPGDLAFGDEDDAAQAGAGGVGGHGGGGVAGGGAGDPLEAALGGDGEGGGHAGVLEGAGGVHALMLGEEPVDAGDFGAAREVVERGVALAEGDDVLEVVDDGEEIAEAPDAGLVDGQGGGAALLPEPAEGAGVGEIAGVRGGVAVGGRRPGVEDVVEAVAGGATKDAIEGIGGDDGTALGASKMMGLEFHCHV